MENCLGANGQGKSVRFYSPGVEVGMINGVGGNVGNGIGWFVGNRVSGVGGGMVQELAWLMCHCYSYENHWDLGKALANLPKPLA